jgi:hypothetical protein
MSKVLTMHKKRIVFYTPVGFSRNRDENPTGIVNMNYKLACL